MVFLWFLLLNKARVSAVLALSCQLSMLANSWLIGNSKISLRLLQAKNHIDWHNLHSYNCSLNSKHDISALRLSRNVVAGRRFMHFSLWHQVSHIMYAHMQCAWNKRTVHLCVFHFDPRIKVGIGHNFLTCGISDNSLEAVKRVSIECEDNHISFRWTCFSRSRGGNIFFCRSLLTHCLNDLIHAVLPFGDVPILPFIEHHGNLFKFAIEHVKLMFSWICFLQVSNIDCSRLPLVIKSSPAFTIFSAHTKLEQCALPDLCVAQVQISLCSWGETFEKVCTKMKTEK